MSELCNYNHFFSITHSVLAGGLAHGGKSFLLFNFDENFMCFLYIYVTSPSLRRILVDSDLTTGGCRVSVWLVASRCFISTAGGGSHVLYCLPSHWWLQYRITIHLPKVLLWSTLLSTRYMSPHISNCHGKWTMSGCFVDVKNLFREFRLTCHTIFMCSLVSSWSKSFLFSAADFALFLSRHHPLPTVLVHHNPQLVCVYVCVCS